MPLKTPHHNLSKTSRMHKDKINLFDFLIYRRISKYLTLLLSKADANPNLISMISLIFSILTFFSFISGNYVGFIFGLIFLQISRIFDCSDGELARLKNKTSEFGFYLDIFLDRLKQVLVYGGAILGFYFFYSNPIILILGIFVLSNLLLGGYITLIKSRLKFINNETEFGINKRIYFGGYSTDIIILSISIIFNKFYLFLLLYSIGGILFWLLPGYKLVKKWPRKK